MSFQDVMCSSNIFPTGQQQPGARHTHTHTHTHTLFFINDAKLLRKIRNHKDYDELHKDINKIYDWSKT